MPLPPELKQLIARSHELVTLRDPEGDWPHKLTLCARNGRLFALLEYAGPNGWDVLTPIVDTNEVAPTIAALEAYTKPLELTPDVEVTVLTGEPQPTALGMLKALRDAVVNTPALDGSAEWTKLIEDADRVLARAERLRRGIRKFLAEQQQP